MLPASELHLFFLLIINKIISFIHSFSFVVKLHNSSLPSSIITLFVIKISVTVPTSPRILLSTTTAPTFTALLCLFLSHSHHVSHLARVGRQWPSCVQSCQGKLWIRWSVSCQLHQQCVGAKNTTGIPWHMHTHLPPPTSNYINIVIKAVEPLINHHHQTSCVLM